MFVWAIADRALDIVGLIAILLWTIRGTLWISRRMPGRAKPHARPRAYRLNGDGNP